MHKEMQTNKKEAKYTVPWVLSVISKLKVQESAGWDLDASSSSDFSHLSFGHQTQSCPTKGKIMQGQHKVPLRCVVTKKGVIEGEWQKQVTVEPESIV